MNYQNTSLGIRSWFVGAAALLLAACGESGDTGSSSSADSASAPSASETIPADAEGTWGDLVYGDPNAPVTVVEYASLTCPHCATFAKTYFPQIEKQFIETGKVKLVYRNYIMNRVDIAASAAARCSNEDVTKKLMKVYFARQSDWARSQDPIDELAALARRAGISRVQFDKCVSNEDMLKHLMAMTNEAIKKYDITSTPSLMLDGKVMEFSSFDDAIKQIADAVAEAG